MDVRTADIGLFVYHLGVVVSGVILVTILGLRRQSSILVASAILAVAWTYYYKRRMQEQLESGEGR